MYNQTQTNMRIVIIEREEELKVGGIVIFNQRFTKFLEKKGHHVQILRFTNKKISESYIHPIPYYYSEPRSYIFLPSEKTLRIVGDLLRKIKPDIVYISIGLSPLDFFIPDLCHNLNIPIAGVWHGDISSQNSAFNVLVKSIFLAYLPFVKQLDLLHVFSQKLADFHVHRGVDRDKILILPNGIDPSIYKPGKSVFYKKNNIKKAVLFLGRLTIVKNPELLIKTFLKIDPPFDTKLIIAGTGDLEQTLRKKYRDGRIIFTGLVSKEKEKVDIIKACDIFVLPSKYEGMSLALLEAMSSGLACIASNVGANDELIDRAGILLKESKLSYELPVVLRLLMENTELVRVLGKKARMKVLKYYFQDKVFYQLMKALTTTVSNHKNKAWKIKRHVKIDDMIIKKVKPVFQKIRDVGLFLTSE